MGWAMGFDRKWQRDIGYGVPAICDHPDCTEEIDRGLPYVCSGQQPHGGDHGCGLFFCGEHLSFSEFDDHGGMHPKNNGEARECDMCERCYNFEPPFQKKADTIGWMDHKLSHESWQKWRGENTALVIEMQKQVDLSDE
jgi:hypothetical protein